MYEKGVWHGSDALKIVKEKSALRRQVRRLIDSNRLTWFGCNINLGVTKNIRQFCICVDTSRKGV